MRKLLWSAFLLLIWPAVQKKITEKLSSPRKPGPKARKATRKR